MKTETNLELKETLDTRDIYEYIIDDLERDSWDNNEPNPNKDEIDYLENLMDEIGNEASYGVTLIRDDYFTEYAQELLEDCGDIPKNIPWYITIDWEDTAKNIQQDYSSLEINNETYWYRA